VPPIDFHALLPVEILAATILVVLVVDLFLPARAKPASMWVSLLGVLAALGAVLSLIGAGERSVFGGAYVVDAFTLIFQGFFLIAALVVLLAFLVIPGWDPVARLLLLDRVPVSRFRVGFAAMLPVFFALVVRHVDRAPSRRLWLVGAATSAGVAAITVAHWLELAGLAPEVLDAARLWPVAALGIVAACGLVFVPRLAPAAAGALLVASMTIGAAVNPFYRGIYDLNDTEIGEAMHEVDDGGAWVGVGSYLTMALVMQTGVDGYNGVQMYPPEETWEEIDPDASDEGVWNRLAHVRWTWGSGEPVFTAPQRDQIVGGFDACSRFAQQYVEYVVSDETPPSTDCLEELRDVDQGRTDMQIYRIVPKETDG